MLSADHDPSRYVSLAYSGKGVDIVYKKRVSIISHETRLADAAGDATAVAHNFCYIIDHVFCMNPCDVPDV